MLDCKNTDSLYRVKPGTMFSLKDQTNECGPHFSRFTLAHVFSGLSVDGPRAETNHGWTARVFSVDARDYSVNFTVLRNIVPSDPCYDERVPQYLIFLTGYPLRGPQKESVIAVGAVNIAHLDVFLSASALHRIAGPEL